MSPDNRPNPAFLVPESADRNGDDPIFALNAEARRRAQGGESIINATLGALVDDEGRLAVMPTVFEVMAGVPPERGAAYAPIAGEPDFLAAVADDTFGPGLLADESVAVATPGGTGALHHAIVNMLDPGQALLTTAYYWGPYRTLAEHTRRRVETFPMFDADMRFDAGALHRALEQQMQRQGRALVILNSPCHNPTGYSLDAAEWDAACAALRAASRQGPVSLLVDLAYARFGAGDPRAWVRHVETLRNDVLVMVAWTASKSYSQYGGRIGALIASHPDSVVRERLANAFSYSCRGTWSNCNHLGMLAITRLLVDPDLAARAHAERKLMRDLLDARVSAFNEHAGKAGLAYPRYEGGFFTTVFTPDAPTTAAAMRERGVFVVPVGGAGAGAVRIALCSTAVRDVPRLVEALTAGVAAAEGASVATRGQRVSADASGRPSAENSAETAGA